jgi:hypothetical protein
MIRLGHVRDRAGHPARLDVFFQAPQIRTQIGGRLVTEIDVFLERLADDVVEPLRQSGIEFADRRRRTTQNRVEDRCGRRPVERAAAGGHFVQHRGDENRSLRPSSGRPSA